MIFWIRRRMAIRLRDEMDIAAIAARPRHQTKTQLWVRSRESMSARRIESGDSATLPFWSTDSALFTRVGSMEGSPVFAAAIGSAAEAGAAAVRANHHLSRWSSSHTWARNVAGRHDLVAGRPRAYAQGRGSDSFGPVSPDEHWLAYVSSATGRPELYVQSFPMPGPKLQVTTDGADLAWWTRDGRGRIFLSSDRQSLWRVDVALGATTRIGTPTQMATLPPNIVAIDAMPDRQRFLALVPERAGTGSATVVLNWQAALGKIR